MVNGEWPYVDERYSQRSYAESVLVEVMKRCWTYDPNERISIFQVVGLLRDAVKKNKELLMRSQEAEWVKDGGRWFYTEEDKNETIGTFFKITQIKWRIIGIEIFVTVLSNILSDGECETCVVSRTQSSCRARRIHWKHLPPLWHFQPPPHDILLTYSSRMKGCFTRTLMDNRAASQLHSWRRYILGGRRVTGDRWHPRATMWPTPSSTNTHPEIY